MCQSPRVWGCWGEQGCPSPTPALCTVPQEGKKHPPWPCTNPRARQGSRGIHLPKHSLHPWTSCMNCCIANREKRPLRGRINLLLRWLPEKGQMNFAWTCLFFSLLTINVIQPVGSKAGTCREATCRQVTGIRVRSCCPGSTLVLHASTSRTGRQTQLRI